MPTSGPYHNMIYFWQYIILLLVSCAFCKFWLKARHLVWGSKGREITFMPEKGTFSPQAFMWSRGKSIESGAVPVQVWVCCRCCYRYHTMGIRGLQGYLFSLGTNRFVRGFLQCGICPQLHDFFLYVEPTDALSPFSCHPQKQAAATCCLTLGSQVLGEAAFYILVQCQSYQLLCSWVCGVGSAQ